MQHHQAQAQHGCWSTAPQQPAYTRGGDCLHRQPHAAAPQPQACGTLVPSGNGPLASTPPAHLSQEMVLRMPGDPFRECPPSVPRGFTPDNLSSTPQGIFPLAAPGTQIEAGPAAAAPQLTHRGAQQCPHPFQQQQQVCCAAAAAPAAPTMRAESGGVVDTPAETPVVTPAHTPSPARDEGLRQPSVQQQPLQLQQQQQQQPSGFHHMGFPGMQQHGSHAGFPQQLQQQQQQPCQFQQHQQQFQHPFHQQQQPQQQQQQQPQPQQQNMGFPGMGGFPHQHQHQHPHQQQLQHPFHHQHPFQQPQQQQAKMSLQEYVASPHAFSPSSPPPPVVLELTLPTGASLDAVLPVCRGCKPHTHTHTHTHAGSAGDVQGLRRRRPSPPLPEGHRHRRGADRPAEGPGGLPSP